MSQVPLRLSCQTTRLPLIRGSRWSPAPPTTKKVAFVPRSLAFTSQVPALLSSQTRTLPSTSGLSWMPEALTTGPAAGGGGGEALGVGVAVLGGMGVREGA